MEYPQRKPNGMTNFETLIEVNNIRSSDRWRPYAVSQFETVLSRGSYVSMSREIRKNIAYNMQYLEYLQLQFDELKLHDIISTLLIKTYIITAMGIIEAIFYHLLKSNNLYRKIEWEQCGEAVHTNQFNTDSGLARKYIITAFRKLPKKVETDMDFESIINKVQDKKLLKITGKAFPYIKHLKRLRNKVHLQIINHPNDTDYNKINWCDYLLARYILYIILTDEIFKQKEDTYFNFIMPNSEQMENLNIHLEQKKTKDED